LFLEEVLRQRQKIRRDLGILNAEQQHASPSMASKSSRILQGRACMRRKVCRKENISEGVHGSKDELRTWNFVFEN